MKNLWKRTFSILLVFVMVCAAAPIGSKLGLSLLASAESYSGSCGTNVTWSLDTSTGVLTIEGDGKMNNFTHHDHRPPWYAYRSSIQTVTIGNGVTSIGNRAFDGLTVLADVTIPDSVTSIGAYGFADCYALADVTIPSSVTSIGNSAFQFCTSLTSVEVPDSVTELGACVFCYCTSLSSITLPNTLTIINEGMFDNCTSLTSITIPFGVTEIYDTAFVECTNLEQIVIPEGVTTIGNGAFSLCTALTTVYLPDSLKSISASAFYECTALSDVYYANTSEKWAGVRVAEDANDCFFDATIHYTSPYKYTLTFDAMGGECATASISIAYGSALGELPVPHRNGYAFGGWHTADDTVVLTEDSIYAVAADSTVYAYWTILGDVDQDEDVDLTDVLLLTRYLAGGWGDLGILVEAGDVNRNGIIEMKDVVLLRRFVVGGWDVELV